MPPRRDPMSAAEMEAEINRRVAETLANQAGASGSAQPPPRPCTYKDFLSCKPTSFAGSEGAVGLIRWMEKLESVFGICDCPEESKVKFASCTLSDDALTWWNAYAQSVGVGTAFQLSWADLKIMMTEEYCPSHELQQLEDELWHLEVKGNDIAAYTSRFHQLAHLCPHLITPETKKIQKYIRGLPESIQGDVTSSKPTTIQSTVSMAHTLLAQIQRRGKSAGESNTAKPQDQKKRKNDESSDQQSRPTKVYAVETQEKNGYKGKRPLCNECGKHHTGQCGVQCGFCKRFGHLTKDCRKAAKANQQPQPINRTANQPNNQNKVKTCYECGGVGHYKNQCGNLRNHNNNKENSS